MPLALLIALILIVAGSVGGVMARHWLPPLASLEGAGFDHQLRISLICIGIAFVLVQLALALFVWRYRANRPGGKAPIADAPLRLPFELFASLLVAAVFFGLAFGGSAQGGSHAAPEPGTLSIEVTSVQFQWYFRYAGPDGQFGATDPRLIDASIGNPLGVIPGDAAGKDDIVSAELVVPLGREVDVELHAQDVIHSFYIPDMRVQMNAVPGKVTHLRFTPTQLGAHELVCAQLCGLGHYSMKATVRVLAAEKFAGWLVEQEARKAAK